MKTYKRVWEAFVSQDNLESAIVAAARGHRHWKAVSRALADVPVAAARLRERIEAGRFGCPTPRLINERGKERKIVCPSFADHAIHHALVQALMPVFMRGMHPDTCGSIPGRGTSYAKKRVERVIKRRRPKYYLQMDVRHFFASVRPEVVLAALGRKVKDRRLLGYVGRLLATTEGLPLGYYTSQWLANFLLTPLDHALSASNGVIRHVRYMDDVVVFGNNKRQLRRVKDSTQAWLATQGLELKPSWKIALFCRPGGMALDFLSYCFGADRTTLRERLFLRARRRLARLRDKLPTAPVSTREAAAGVSYDGWLQSSACYGYKVREGVFAVITRLKKILRGDAYGMA